MSGLDSFGSTNIVLDDKSKLLAPSLGVDPKDGRGDRSTALGESPPKLVRVQVFDVGVGELVLLFIDVGY